MGDELQREREWKEKYVARFVEVARNSAETSLEAGKDNYNFLEDDPVECADTEMEAWADD